MMKTKDIINQFNNIECLPMFEIPVLDKRTNEETYVIANISISGRSFLAQFEPLTVKQSKSKYIAHVKQVVDPVFSLDENLQELYSSVISEIIGSDYFDLRD